MTRHNPSNPRRIKPGARDQLRKRVLAEENTCHLCGHPVDTSLPAHLDGSPEVDEILPVSRGGDPTDRDNVRLAHRACNRARGNRLISELPTPQLDQPPGHPLHETPVTWADSQP